MKEHLELRAVEMRCRNVETKRRRIWRNLALKFNAGKITPNEAMQIKLEFWQRVTEDELLLRSKRKSRRKSASIR